MRIFTLPPAAGTNPEPNFYDSLQKVRLRQQLEMYSLGEHPTPQHAEPSFEVAVAPESLTTLNSLCSPDIRKSEHVELKGKKKKIFHTRLVPRSGSRGLREPIPVASSGQGHRDKAQARNRTHNLQEGRKNRCGEKVTRTCELLLEL